MMKFLYCRCSEKWGPLAPLVLRLALGIVFFAHGWQKIDQMGAEGVTGFFDSLGIPFPAFFAILIIALELVGGAALILGILTHWIAKLFAIEMLVAFLLVHLENGVFVQNGGFELVLVLMAGAISLVITGAGKWSLGHMLFKHPESPQQPSQHM